MTVRKLAFWCLFTIAHAALTVGFFLLYVDYALKVDHGTIDPTMIGTLAQYLKSALLLPLLLPYLRWYTGVAAGPLGYVVVLLNSALWAWGCNWVWRRLRRYRRVN